MRRVLIAGLPKSGTTYLYSIIAAALPGCIGLFEPHSFEEPTAKDRSIVAKVLVGGATDLNQFLSFSPAVVLVRDPRDRLVSQFLYEGYGGPHSTLYRDSGRLRQLTLLLRKKIDSPESVTLASLLEVAFAVDSVVLCQQLESLHEASINVTKSCRDLDHPHYVLRYEDLVRGQVFGLERALGLALNLNTEVPTWVNRVVRSRSFGEWCHWWTREDIELLCPYCQPFLDFYDYPIGWDLATRPEISQTHSLDYLLRLVSERKAAEAQSRSKR